ncbi:hypothetical protein N7457_007373 [Penicillium paradoxum]|uniref:uncharacterized protein n=1 Tax=Penicillium paradoxum TaxID=176176 RepID=UPI0025481605|nr:uncharacterized protein N7457_007373 [Penicillium paradoxum]KAJ5779653.1 hypothetical protein N7457_007373 [Penicillium paradoxum]
MLLLVMIPNHILYAHPELPQGVPPTAKAPARNKGHVQPYDSVPVSEKRQRDVRVYAPDQKAGHWAGTGDSSWSRRKDQDGKGQKLAKNEQTRQRQQETRIDGLQDSRAAERQTHFRSGLELIFKTMAPGRDTYPFTGPLVLVATHASVSVLGILDAVEFKWSGEPRCGPLLKPRA